LGCAVARGENLTFPQPSLQQAWPARVVLSSLTVGSVYRVRVFPLREGTGTRPEGLGTFELSLSPWEAPANDEPSGAVSVAVSSSHTPCSSPVEFTLDGATPSLPVPPGTARIERDVWFSFVAPPRATGSSFQVLLQLNSSSPQMLWGSVQIRDGFGPTSQALLTSGPNSGAGIGYNFLTPGQTYYLRFYNDSDNPEPFSSYSFCLSTGLNDEPCGALPLPISVGGQCTLPVQGTTFGATSSSGPSLQGASVVPNCGYGFGGLPRDVWYRVVPGTTAFTLHSDDATVGMARLYQPAVAGGTCSDVLQLINCQSSTPIGVGQQRGLGTVFFDNLTPGQPYYLGISSDNAPFAPSGDFTLCAQASTTLPARAAAGGPGSTLWPNPVVAGEVLQVQLPAGQAPNAQIRLEWLTAQGQVLPDQQAGHRQATAGVVQVPTQGRPPGLYLLRLWLPDGQLLPVHRVVLK
jgi:hypothetical protein